MFKSIAVVIGCYALSVDLVLATDPLLSRLFPGDYVRGRVPSDTVLMASTAFFVVISILFAWPGARLAPSAPCGHVLWFLIIEKVRGIVPKTPNWGRAGRTGTG